MKSRVIKLYPPTEFLHFSQIDRNVCYGIVYHEVGEKKEINITIQTMTDISKSFLYDEITYETAVRSRPFLCSLLF